MPRNVLKGRSNRDLAAEYVLRKYTSQPPVKLYSTQEIYDELCRRGTLDQTIDLINEAEKVAKILGD